MIPMSSVISIYLLSVYLLIGALMLCGTTKYINELIGKHERGDRMEENETSFLDALSTANKTMGGKRAFFIIASSMILFWLPMIIKDFYTKRKNKRVA